MFKLLLSEIKYSKISISIIFVIILLANIFLTARGQWTDWLIINKTSKIIWGLFTIYYVVFAQSILQYSPINKKRRIGQQKSLPLSNYQISSFRIFYSIFLWMIPVIILSFFYTINVGQPFNFQWLQIAGFMTIVYILFTVNIFLPDDLSVLKLSKQNLSIKFFSKTTVYVIIYLLNYFVVAKINFDFNNPSAVFNQIAHNYLLSRSGIELNLILGIVLLIASIFTFNKMKAFL